MRVEISQDRPGVTGSEVSEVGLVLDLTTPGCPVELRRASQVTDPQSDLPRGLPIAFPLGDESGAAQARAVSQQSGTPLPNLVPRPSRGWHGEAITR